LAYLCNPLLGKLVGLLALDAESRGCQDEVALIETSSPLEIGVYDATVDAGYVVKDIGQMGAVEIERVDGGVAVRIRRSRLCERQTLDLRR
jgi:hypothetical protein